MEQMYRTFTVFCLALLLGAPAAYAKKAVGTMMVVKGKVFIQSKGKKKPKKARVGTKVKSSDTIITKKNARVKVVMIDKNIIHVSPESKMSFEKYVFDKSKGKKDVLLNVLYGKVRSNVKQKYDGKKNRYQVKTKAAVAGVRGTDFLSSYNPATNAANFITFKGMVAVGLPGAGGILVNPVNVAPGQQTSAALGGPGIAPPTKMDQKAFQQADAFTNGGDGPRFPAGEPGPEFGPGGEEGGPNGPGGPEGEGPNGPGGPGGPDGAGFGPEGPEGEFAEGGPDGPRGPNGPQGPGGPGGPEGNFAEGGPEGPGFGTEGGPNGPGFGPDGGPGGGYGEGDRGPAAAGGDGGGFDPAFGGGMDAGNMLGPPPPPTEMDQNFIPPEMNFDTVFLPPPTGYRPDLIDIPNPCQDNPEACGQGNTRLIIEIQ